MKTMDHQDLTGVVILLAIVIICWALSTSDRRF